MSATTEEAKKRSTPTVPAVLAIVLGMIAVVSGLGGNSAVVLVGLVAIGLGAWAISKQQRKPAIWGAVIAGLAILGYVGSLTTPS